MSALLPEVWVWLSRTHDGQLHARLPEALHEAGALARRLEIPLVGLGDRALAPEERSVLVKWDLSALRMVPGPQSPHPQIQGGRSPFAALGTAPRAFVLLADVFGSVTAPLFAAETGATLVSLATSVTSDPKHYVVSRPMLGEQYEALVTAPLQAPIVVTLQPGSVGDVDSPVLKAANAREIPILGPHQLLTQTSGTHRVLLPQADSLSVSDADRIVAFGRGAFSREAITLVEKVAKLLGATVAGTRPAADEGWLPFAKQVGLTGAIVTPKLYVAVGISGAPYHMVGVKDPETLIAINSDPEAPIFASAHLGIVGDLHALLPALIARLERGQALPQAATALRKGIAS